MAKKLVKVLKAKELERIELARQKNENI